MTFSFQSNVSMRRYVLKVRAIDCILFECVRVCVHVGGMYAYLCVYVQRPEEGEGYPYLLFLIPLRRSLPLSLGLDQILARLWASQLQQSSLCLFPSHVTGICGLSWLLLVLLVPG